MSESRQLISDSIHRIFRDAVTPQMLAAFEEGHWPAELWTTVADNGFHRLLDIDGSAALDWDDAQPALFALGYYRVPLPLGETLLANWLCARAGLAVAEGPQTVVDGEGLAFERAADGRWTVSGTVQRVPWARVAQRFVIAGSAGGQQLIGVCGNDPSSVAIDAGRNLSAEPRDEVRFTRCPLQGVGFDARLPRDPVKLYGALVRAVCMAGAANSVLDQSVQYVNDRKQFGRALAKFQAVQHLLAELGEECAAVTMAATAACAAAGSATAPLEIAVAKVRAGQMAARVPRIAHQVHGAMGFTYEYSLHFGTRRLWAWRREFGSDAAWASQIGLAAIAAGQEGFWPRIMTGSDMAAGQQL